MGSFPPPLAICYQLTPNHKGRLTHDQGPTTKFVERNNHADRDNARGLSDLGDPV